MCVCCLSLPLRRLLSLAAVVATVGLKEVQVEDLRGHHLREAMDQDLHRGGPKEVVVVVVGLQEVQVVGRRQDQVVGLQEAQAVGRHLDLVDGNLVADMEVLVRVDGLKEAAVFQVDGLKEEVVEAVGN